MLRGDQVTVIMEFEKERTVYTIGHSTHDIERFGWLLKRHGLDTVMDLRSVPYSSRCPQFDRKNLIHSLKAQDIEYVFLGRSLGARSDNPECYEDGRVKYRLLAGTASFRKGIKQVCEGARYGNIVLMCAEEDPLNCHRTILVARELVKKGLDVGHILADGRVEPHDMVIKRLMERLGLRRQPDLFLTEKELMERAYELQERRIAYSDKRSVRKPRENLS